MRDRAVSCLAIVWAELTQERALALLPACAAEPRPAVRGVHGEAVLRGKGAMRDRAIEGCSPVSLACGRRRHEKGPLSRHTGTDAQQSRVALRKQRPSPQAALASLSNLYLDNFSQSL